MANEALRMTDEIGFVYRGLEVTAENGYMLDRFDGWTGWPAGGRAAQTASSRHGEIPSPVSLPVRTISAGGEIGPDNRRALMRAMAAAFTPPDLPTVAEVYPFDGTFDGITRTADAQLTRFDMPLDPAKWVGGVVRWEAQWVCADPYLYDAWTLAVSSPLTGSLTGALIPALMPFFKPDSPFGGSVVVDNPGASPSPAEYTITGPIITGAGVANETTNRQVGIDYPLAAGDVLRIVTGPRGFVEINGIRQPTTSGSAAVRNLAMAPGANTIRALGVPGTGAPILTARVRPAYPTGM